MKICIVSQEYPPETGGGGIGTQSWLKAQGLSARGHEVHVVSASWDKQARTYNDGKAVIHRIPEPQLPVPGFEQSSYWLGYSAAAAAKLMELTRQVKFDIFQFPEYCGEGFYWQSDTFAWRPGKYVVQLHGPLAMLARHMGWPDIGSTMDRIGRFMERTVIHNSDLVMASSHNTARFCAAEYEYPLERIRVIHSGIDTARFAPAPQPASERFPRILFVGNLVGSKGFDLLISAIIRLKDRYPKILLRTIGKGDAEHVREQMNRARAAGASDHIHIAGYVPHQQLPEHFAWCDMFAGPSTYEPGPGNVYLEAMACGRPVIACNSAGTPEVVPHGKTGLLIPPRDLEALVEAIAKLAEDAKLRREMGEAGRQWAVENFTIDRYIDRVEGLYRGLCGQEG